MTDHYAKPQAMTAGQLAKLYNVHYQTFIRWIKPFETKIGEKHNGSRIYTPAQVIIIFECLGEP